MAPPAESGADALNSGRDRGETPMYSKKRTRASASKSSRCADDQTADVVSDIALTRNDLLTGHSERR